jgi:5-amino-6-(5-phosphoribosylamino)uracil reductase
MSPRPHVTAVMAMSADGKLADHTRSAGRFGSKQDQDHLEARVAEADAVLFGAGTLRAYGTTMSVQDPQLQADRADRGQSAQPIQIVCSASGDLDPDCHYFSQPIPRWLLTTNAGTKDWGAPQFDRVWAVGEAIDWPIVMAGLTEVGRRWKNCWELLGSGRDRRTLADDLPADARRGDGSDSGANRWLAGSSGPPIGVDQCHPDR